MKKSIDRILYIGSLQEKSNSYRRFLALKRIEDEVEGIDIVPFIYNSKFAKLHHHLNYGPGIKTLNKKVVETAAKFRPTIVIVDNRPFIGKWALKKLIQFHNAKIVNILTDDPFGLYPSGWITLKKTARLYDFYFVQRDPNIIELKRLGAANVIRSDRSFDPILHKHLILSSQEKSELGAEIGFIGTYAPYRSMIIAKLIEYGYPVNVWGNNWSASKDWEIIRPFFRGKAAYLDDYVKLINSIDIHLHFLRKENRDDQDSRTFEIPACGGFMLAERTERHEFYFKEGKEASFFSDFEELESKLQYYLNNKLKIKKIGKNAALKVRELKCDHDSRLKFILTQVRKNRTI